MAIIRDMIPAFDLFQPASLDEASDLLRRHGSDAWVLAGGQDSFDWFKDRIKRPAVVVDLGGIDELRGVRDEAGGLEIGAMTPLAEVVRDPRIAEAYPLLATAARHVATPQIRNQGTLGGNVAQDMRCWYYRSGWPCYRAGGNVCYAAAPHAMNREHCILGADRCVAVNPSDTAPALLALDARMVVRRGDREEEVAARDFFVGPGTDITRTTVLGEADLLTAVRIPADWGGARFYFEKVRDRMSWDFALVTVAAAFRVNAGAIEAARIAANGVAPTPLRLEASERAVVGKPVDVHTEAAAGEAAVRDASPLRHNDFKVPLLRNLVRRAVRSAAS